MDGFEQGVLHGKVSQKGLKGNPDGQVLFGEIYIEIYPVLHCKGRRGSDSGSGYMNLSFSKLS